MLAALKAEEIHGRRGVLLWKPGIGRPNLTTALQEDAEDGALQQLNRRTSTDPMPEWITTSHYLYIQSHSLAGKYVKEKNHN